MIELYRAICEEEMLKTLHFQTLQYHRNREKCFSPSLDWILKNPCNGRFNNSNFKEDKSDKTKEQRPTTCSEQMAKGCGGFTFTYWLFGLVGLCANRINDGNDYPLS